MIDINVFREVMQKIADEKEGEFTFIGLFHRDGQTFGKWDVVVSAPWFEKGSKELTRYVAGKLQATLPREHLLTLSRVVTIQDDDPRLDALLKQMPVDNEPLMIRNVTLFDVDIREAHILRAKRSPQTTAVAAGSPV